jgi:hypothetical protein
MKKTSEWGRILVGLYYIWVCPLPFEVADNELGAFKVN